MNYFTLLEHWKELDGEKPFVVIEDTPYTYAQVYALASCRFTHLDLPEKTAVLIRSQELLSQLTAFLGLQGKRLTPVLCHYDLPAASILTMMKKNGVRYLLTDGALPEDDFSLTEKRDVLSLYAAKGVAERKTADDACMGALSSGSTDVPKVLYRTYESWAGFFATQNRVFQIGRATKLFLEGSLSFTGNLNLLMDALYVGATAVLTNVFRCYGWLRMIERYETDVLYMVPAKLKVMARAFKDAVYPNVRMILCGSQLLEARTGEALLRAMPRADIILYYGASELNYISYLTYQELKARPHSVGRPFDGVRVKIKDELIYVDSPYFVCGKPRPCTVNDTGHIDGDGYILFGGRREAVINKGGFKVNCLKVENALKEHEAVRDALVIGYEEAGHGQQAAAFIAAEREIPRAQMLSFLRQTLSRQEIPKRYIFVREIPLNSLGKADVRKLKELL